MRIEKHFDGVDVPTQVHGFIDERVEHALESIGEHVREVTIKLRDLAGPKGSPSIECTIIAEVAGPKTIVIDERAETASSAVTNAAARLGTNVRKHLDRLRDRRA